MGTYPPGWGSGSGEHGAAADAARARTAASDAKKKKKAGSPDEPGGSRSSRPGQPDRPGEAKAKMISAGVMTSTGEMKQIVGHYKDPRTDTFKFAAKGEPLPRIPLKPEKEPDTAQFQVALSAQQTQGGFIGPIQRFNERTLRPEYTSGTAYQHDRPYQHDPTIIDMSMRKLKESDVAVSKRLPFQPDPFTAYTQFWSDFGKPLRERYDTGKMPVVVQGGREFVRGASRGVYEKPVTTVVTAGAFALAAPAIGGATAAASGLPVVGAYAAPIVKATLAGMGGLYAYGVHRRISAPEETIIRTEYPGVPSMTGAGHLVTERHVFRERTFPEKMGIAGRIMGTEIIPMGVGARLAAHPPPVPKVTVRAGVYRLDVGQYGAGVIPRDMRYIVRTPTRASVKRIIPSKRPVQPSKEATRIEELMPPPRTRLPAVQAKPTIIEVFKASRTHPDPRVRAVADSILWKKAAVRAKPVQPSAAEIQYRQARRDATAAIRAEAKDMIARKEAIRKKSMWKDESATVRVPGRRSAQVAVHTPPKPQLKFKPLLMDAPKPQLKFKPLLMDAPKISVSAMKRIKASYRLKKQPHKYGATTRQRHIQTTKRRTAVTRTPAIGIFRTQRPTTVSRTARHEEFKAERLKQQRRLTYMPTIPATVTGLRQKVQPVTVPEPTTITEAQRIKTPTYTPVKTIPVTPSKPKKELPKEPKPKPFALPKLPDGKAKRRIRRKKPTEAEYWQIVNPIASIQQMIAGRTKNKR